MSSFMRYATLAGLYNPPKVARPCKDELYYVRLTREEQKLPYECKQELRRLKWTLEKMNKKTELQIVYEYKFR